MCCFLATHWIPRCVVFANALPQNHALAADGGSRSSTTPYGHILVVVGAVVHLLPGRGGRGGPRRVGRVMDLLGYVEILQRRVEEGGGACHCVGEK